MFQGDSILLQTRFHSYLDIRFADNYKRFQDALVSDLGRPPTESALLELDQIAGHILNAYTNVEKWAKPDSVPVKPNFYFMGPKIIKEPKGAVLIIGPFNYPGTPPTLSNKYIHFARVEDIYLP